MNIRLAARLQTDSIVDGEGIRAVIWTQGCKHNCKGCQNRETHNFKGGFEVDTEELKKDIENLKLHRGITFSGGDPMEQPEACEDIARYVKSLGMDVWCYTGYTFEELTFKGGIRYKNSWEKFLQVIDVLIDGKFVESEKSLCLYYRGSKNQRIIDVRESLKLGKAVLLDEFMGEKEVVEGLYRYKVSEVVY